MMKVSYLIILVCVSLKIDLSLCQSCYSPDQYPGTCVELSNCKPISNLRFAKNPTHTARLYVSLSLCGKKINNQPLVCCTNSLLPQRLLPNSIEQEASQNILPTTGPVTRQPATLSTNFFTRAPQTTTSYPFFVSTPKTKTSRSDNECSGILNNRIFGGRTAGINELPFTALIAYSKGPRTGFYCGGALINKQFVLTAAHCTHADLLRNKQWVLRSVRLGEWDSQMVTDCQEFSDGTQLCAPPVRDFQVDQVITHENFSPYDQSLSNDIALIKLRGSVEFNDFVRPACMPTEDRNFENVELIVAGFGKTESSEKSRFKLKTEIVGVSNQACQNVYANDMIAITSNQICALGTSGQDSCTGDSGQPLIYANSKTSRLEVVGVVSYGPSPCGEFERPGVYTRVAPYLNWIQSKLR